MNTLNNDCLRLVLSQLPIHDVAHVAQVCRRINYQIQNDNNLWKTLFARDFPTKVAAYTLKPGPWGAKYIEAKSLAYYHSRLPYRTYMAARAGFAAGYPSGVTYGAVHGTGVIVDTGAFMHAVVIVAILFAGIVFANRNLSGRPVVQVITPVVPIALITALYVRCIHPRLPPLGAAPLTHHVFGVISGLRTATAAAAITIYRG